MTFSVRANGSNASTPGTLMNRVTATCVLAFAGLALAAPRPQDAPKKDSPIVGEWQLRSVNGRPTDAYSTETYTGDGAVIDRTVTDSGAEERRGRYTINLKTDPAEIDVQFGERRGDRYEGIFRIEGDTLTICYRFGVGGRPNSFGGTKTLIEYYDRVKTKK